jgi:S-adenosylmethionine decarboxylase proenzyme
MKALGRHTLLDFYGCDADTLKTVEQVRSIMCEAARQGQATIVNETFHQFSPHGISGVVVIAESHLAIHTWPEHGYAAVDLFTCGETIVLERIEACLKAGFGARSVERRELARGALRMKNEPADGFTCTSRTADT